MELKPRERELFCKCFLFCGLPEECLLGYLEAPGCSSREFQRGELIYGGTQFTRCLGLLLSGSADVSKSAEGGRSLAISTLYPGMVFGAAAMFNDAAAFANVITARASCRVLFLEEAWLTQLMREHFCVAEAYIRYLSGRILFLNDRIAALVAGTSEQRVAHFLLQSAPELTISMTELASRLNLGRASLYRVMDRLEASGAIRREGKVIQILHPELLTLA